MTYNDANDGTGHSAVVTDEATVWALDHYTFTTIGAQTAALRFRDSQRLRQLNRLLTVYNARHHDRLGRRGGVVGYTNVVDLVAGVWTGSVTVNAVDPPSHCT